MDDNNELIIYVLQQLRQGVPEQVVRTTLAQNGWPQPLIDRAFSMVQQARPHEVPPTTQYQGPAPVGGFASTQAATPQQNNELPAALKPSKTQKSSRRGLIAGIVITVAVLAVAGGAALFVLNNRSEKPTATTQQQTDTGDEERKKSLESLATKLEAYYEKNGTYPTLAAVNDPAFANTEGGFDLKLLQDPSWDAKKSPCVSKEGTAIFAETRAEGCISFRSTALNGSECNGADIKCTRVVITSTLNGNKPYLIAIDQNKREE